MISFSLSQGLIIVFYLIIGNVIYWKMSTEIYKYRLKKSAVLTFMCIFAWPLLIVAGIIKDKL